MGIEEFINNQVCEQKPASASDKAKPLGEKELFLKTAEGSQPRSQGDRLHVGYTAGLLCDLE